MFLEIVKFQIFKLKLPITKNCGLRLLDEFLVHFLKLHFLDLFVAEIQIIIMFRFSLVYVGVFGNRQI